MADVIYEVPFGSAGSINQGYTGTKAVEYRTRALIVTYPGFRLPPVNWQGNLGDFLQDAVQNDDPEQRIQILTNIQGAEADNTAATPLEFSYGPSQRIYGDQKATNYTFGDTDLVKHQLRQALNDVGSDKLVIRWDERNQLVGTADETGLMRGFSVSEIFANDIEQDAGNGVAQTMRISWANPAENNRGNLIILPSKVTPGSLTNVMSIQLKELTDLNSSRVVTLAFMGGGNNFPFNLAQRTAYQTILVNNPGLVNFRTALGAALTITSAAPAFVNGQHGVTYTLSATGYPVAGQLIYVDMDAVSVLNTAFGTPMEVPQPIVLTVV